MWPPFGPLWSVKYLNFWEKLVIRSVHHTLLESSHPEVTKNPCYVSSPEDSQRQRYQLMDYSEILVFSRITFPKKEVNLVIISGFPFFVFRKKNLWALFVLHNREI